MHLPSRSPVEFYIDKSHPLGDNIFHIAIRIGISDPDGHLPR